MADLVRARKLTLPDGTAPFYLDGRIIITALPQFQTLNMSKPILVDGEDFQTATPRQFSVTFVGTLVEDSSWKLRKLLQRLDTRFGLRNRRFYLNDDHYWIVRSEGMRVTFPWVGVRDRMGSIEFYLRMLDPFLRDDDNNLYRAW